MCKASARPSAERFRCGSAWLGGDTWSCGCHEVMAALQQDGFSHPWLLGDFSILTSRCTLGLKPAFSWSYTGRFWA